MWLWILLGAEAADIVTIGTAENSGPQGAADRALAVVLHEDLDVTVAGAIHGEDEDATDAYLGHFHVALSSERWRRIWSAGPIGDAGADSADAVHALVDLGDGTLGWCGRLGLPTPGGEGVGVHWSARAAPEPVAIDAPISWESAREGALDQACLGMAGAGDDVVTASVARVADDADSWWTRREDWAIPLVNHQTVWPTDRSAGLDTRPWDVALDPGSGDYVVVGQVRSASGDLDAVIRYHDTEGARLWSATLGEREVDERATSVVFDSAGRVVVGLYESTPKSGVIGTVRSFYRVGDGQGGPDEAWRTEVGGVDPQLVFVDGTLHVGVGQTNQGSGLTRFSVLSLKEESGEVEQTLANTGFLQGPAVLAAFDARDRVYAFAGYRTEDTGSAGFVLVTLGIDTREPAEVIATAGSVASVTAC